MEKVYQTFKDKDAWIRKSIMAALSMGQFSSDRSIQNYADKIWNIKPIKVPFEA
jgi:starch phosphorylase